MLEWGAAGNVVSYNYTMGEFDSGATNLDIGGIDFHGAHPQFNLLEGNVVTEIAQDSVWGTSSQTTAFRNWVVGTNRICSPMSGRGAVKCSGANGHYGFQAARAIEMSYLGTANNFIGNVVGSAQMQSMKGYNFPWRKNNRLSIRPGETMTQLLMDGRSDTAARATMAAGRDAAVEKPPCHRSGTSSTHFLHGNYNNIGASTAWAAGVTHRIACVVLSEQEPAWWGRCRFLPRVQM